MPPASWSNANRTSVQLIVIHTTEGSAHNVSAEDGAAYDQRRTDGVSTHYFHDNDSTVQCVRTEDIAYAARAQGNKRGIQHELCGKAGWSASTWAGEYAQAMLVRAAKQAARDAKKWGIPVRHLTVSEVASGEKGFCSHYDVTRAFPQDNGTHTDPGPNFPWSQFLDMVRDELEGDMTPEEFLAYDPNDEDGIPNPFADKETNKTISPKTAFYNSVSIPMRIESAVGALKSQVSALGSSLLAAVNAREDVDEVALAAALAPALAPLILAGLPTGTLTQSDVEAAVRNVLIHGTGE